MALPPPQIRMHHVALDRTGPDDRHLDDQVVELVGLQPGQHRHLGPALDLEHPHAVGLGQHVVDALHLDRHVGQVDDRLAVVGAQHAERPLDGGQHAQRQHVDLHQLQAVDVVLVPLDEGAVLHRRVADRHGLVQPPLGQHEAADVLRQVARVLQQLGGQGDGPGDLRVLGDPGPSA
jgi:hypothetical protein